MLLLAAHAVVSAHRTDEYLQAARLGIDPGGLQIELDLTPGIALADAILADLDRNRDGSLSLDERRAYANLVLSALTLEVDGRPVRAELTGTSFPDTGAMRRGEGTIRLQSAATFPRLPAGPHQVLFRNRHHPDRSVYLANALAPASDAVAVTGQSRDIDQTELTIAYVLRAAPTGTRPAAAWLLGALAAAAALAVRLIRPRRHH